MPYKEIVVLAMTRMHGGVCIAGLDGAGVWVRPVKDFGPLRLGDVTYRDGSIVRSFDLVRVAASHGRTSPPHVEDWVGDFRRQRPQRLGALGDDQRLSYLAAHVDPAPEEVLSEQRRSLCLVVGQRVEAVFCHDSYSGKYEARVGFALCGRTWELPCTDVKWRSLGRRLLAAKAEAGTLVLPEAKLRQDLALEHIHLVLGLSRPYQGRCWPMVVGVHTTPDYACAVDYGDL